LLPFDIPAFIAVNAASQSSTKHKPDYWEYLLRNKWKTSAGKYGL
jgi:hypothetical protein